MHANLLINAKNYNNYKQVATLSRNEMLSSAKDFLNCSHRNKKYLIVGLYLNQ